MVFITKTEKYALFARKPCAHLLKSRLTLIFCVRFYMTIEIADMPHLAKQKMAGGMAALFKKMHSLQNTRMDATGGVMINTYQFAGLVGVSAQKFTHGK